jgi:hypothetical protein
LNSAKSSWKVEISLTQTPVYVDILTFSHESWVFLMASGMVNPFQKVCSLHCLDLREFTVYEIYSLMKCIS